ncbi:hypothetical protein PENTCL1PPCAC_29816, partial [Pristionchus entomophagus]
KQSVLFQDRDCRYTCVRCRNHAIVAFKKNHTPCPFSLCCCDHCCLVSEKRRIDLELTAISNEYALNGEKINNYHSSSSESESDDLYISPEAKRCIFFTQVMLDLVNSLTFDSFDPESFDYKALSNFFAQPTIMIPNEWAPLMGEISELVRISLKRIPRLDGIEF